MTLLAQKGIDNPVVSGLVGQSEGNAGGIFGKFLSGIIGFLLIIAAIWSFLQLLIGALGWISSGGDKGKLEAAQQKILQAIIGLGLVFASWAIIMVVLRFLGITGTSGGFNLKLPKLF